MIGTIDDKLDDFFLFHKYIITHLIRLSNSNIYYDYNI